MMTASQADPHPRRTHRAPSRSASVGCALAGPRVSDAGAYNFIMTSVPHKASRKTSRIYRPGDRPAPDLSWDDSTPEQRMEAAWELTLQCLAMQGTDPGEPRLQRSAVRIQRSWR